jgi:hypothetical protein
MSNFRCRKVAIWIAMIFALVGSTVVQSATTAAAAPAANAFTTIRNVDTNMCVQAQADAESPLMQTACSDSQSQRWIFVPNSNGNLIVNQRTGLCVYMDGPVVSGSPIIQTGCNGVTNEDWKATLPPSVTRIMSRTGHRDTNLCLAPQDSGVFALLRLFPCNGDLAELWILHG